MSGDHPEFTEFGIKIHKLRLTVKVQKRASSASSTSRSGSTSSDDRVRRGYTAHQSRRSRTTSSSTSSIADSLRHLDLDSHAGSRRPIVQDSSGTRIANWEFQGFYSPPQRTSTPSSGYSSAAISRTSSFSSDAYGGPPRSAAVPIVGARQNRITSADDSIYSDVYSTIEELAELPDPFDDNNDEPTPTPPSTSTSSAESQIHMARPPTLPKLKATSKAKHQKTKSMTCLLDEPTPSSHTRTKSYTVTTSTSAPAKGSQHSKISRSSTSLDLPPNIAPPLPPRTSRCRPPARPPYPSSLVRAVQNITKPLNR